jgi:membrane-bound lytic murein transglycosylase B
VTNRWGLLLSAVALAVALPAPAAGPDNGWRHLIDKLVADGVSRRTAERIFRDPNVPAFSGLTYALVPRESQAAYRNFLKSDSVRRAKRCKQDHEAILRRAERDFEVDHNVVTAILFVETQCGHFTGNHRVLPRLARLAMANEPGNVNRNVNAHLAAHRDRPPAEVATLSRQRAQYLEDLFYPEVLATFTISQRLGIDPLGIRGSGAGAFGMPQFLPTSYLKYGVDGNANGSISLFDPADAIASCANYLKAHGWKPGLPEAERRKVIWQYNRSEPYVETILSLADTLR